MFDTNLVLFKYGKRYYDPYNYSEESEQDLDFSESKKIKLSNEICFYDYKKISEKHIKMFENYYDIVLPTDFKYFLLNYNGLFVETFIDIDNITYIALNKYLEEKKIGVDMRYFLGLFDIVDKIENTEEFLEYKEKVKIEKRIPIAESVNSFKEIWLGVGKDNQGKIFILDNCNDIDIYLCDSFTDYISDYYLEKDI